MAGQATVATHAACKQLHTLFNEHLHAPRHISRRTDHAGGESEQTRGHNPCDMSAARISKTKRYTDCAVHMYITMLSVIEYTQRLHGVFCESLRHRAGSYSVRASIALRSKGRADVDIHCPTGGGLANNTLSAIRRQYAVCTFCWNTPETCCFSSSFRRVTMLCYGTHFPCFTTLFNRKIHLSHCTVPGKRTHVRVVLKRPRHSTTPRAKPSQAASL